MRDKKKKSRLKQQASEINGLELVFYARSMGCGFDSSFSTMY